MNGDIKNLLNGSSNPDIQRAQLGTLLEQAQAVGFRNENAFFVSPDGEDGRSGTSWDQSFKTIQHALNVARRVNGALDYSKNRLKYVYVWPGQYNEQVLWSGYNIHLMGVQPFGNDDYGPILNYDGSSGTPAAMAFSGAGCSIQGLQINMTTAYPALYLSIADGCLINNVTIKGNATSTIGIWGANVKKTIITNCHIYGGFATAGISVGQGDGGDTYFCGSEISHNKISSSGTVAILVHANAVASVGLASYIHQNLIAGDDTTGIHQDAAGAYVLVSDNWIQAGTAVTDDGTGAADNHTAS